MDTERLPLTNFQILFLLPLQYQSCLRPPFLQSRKFLGLSFSSYVLFRGDFGLLSCKQVLELHILMLFILPCITIIAYQLHRFASRIHHSIITSNSCALRRHRELHFRILPTALSLLSIKEMCQHHSYIRVLSPSLDRFLKHVLSRLRLGRSLLVLLDGKLVSSFVPPWHLFQPLTQTLP